MSFQSIVYYKCECDLEDQFAVLRAGDEKKLERFKKDSSLGTCEFCQKKKTVTEVFGPKKTG